jgi:hypothetical protein
MEHIDPQKQRQEQQRQEQLRIQEQKRQARLREEQNHQNQIKRGKSAANPYAPASSTSYQSTALTQANPPVLPKYSQLNLFGFHGIDPNLFRTPLTFTGSQPLLWGHQEQEHNSHWQSRQAQRNQQQQEREEKYKYNQLDWLAPQPKQPLKVRQVTDSKAGWMSLAEQERQIKAGTLNSDFDGLRAIADYMAVHPADPLPRGADLDEWLAKAEAFKNQKAQKNQPPQSRKESQTQPTFSEKDKRWQLSGSNADEIITVTQDPQRTGWYSFEIKAPGKLTGRGSIAAKELSQLDLHGGGGNDTIGLIGQMPKGMRVYGDAGADTVLKTEGNETLPIDGGKGLDRIYTTPGLTDATFAPKPEAPVQQFQRELKENALAALAANRARLDHQQKLYQDPNPKSPHWQALWNAASAKRESQRQQTNLQQQYEFTIQEINRVSITPDQNSGRMATAAEIQNSPKQKQLEALSKHKKELEGQITFSKQLQLELDYEFPALSALSGESKNTVENNRAILGRIPEKFGEMRGSIGDLEHQIQSDPKVALRLDKVVEQTLKAGVSVADVRSPKETLEVLRWLANEGFWKNVGTGAGVVGTGVLGLGSVLLPEVGLLRWGAVALGLGTAAAQLPR